MVKAFFTIAFHQRDLSLLVQIQKNFLVGVGSISHTRNAVYLSVSGIKDLTNYIIPHFYKYPSLTQKAADFILFKQVVDLMSKREYLSIEGLQKIINIKASLNTGISEIVKSEFINVSPVARPLILTNNIPDPNRVAGFVSGEGNFDVRLPKSKAYKIGYRSQLRFRITQHDRDINLMNLLIKYLGTGKYTNIQGNLLFL